MPKATLTKGFEHNGTNYRIGDTFEGSEAEIDALTRQGYIQKKAGTSADAEEAKAVDTGTGKGADVSASSRGDAGYHHSSGSAEPTRKK